MHNWALEMQRVIGKANECKVLKNYRAENLTFVKTKKTTNLKILKTSVLEIVLLVSECTKNEIEVTVKLSKQRKGEKSVFHSYTSRGLIITSYT